MRGPGRWHTTGRPVVYLASMPSLAMLEVLANTTAADLTRRNYHLMRVELPTDATTDLPLTELPEDWNAPQRVQGTARLGDAFLAARAHLALRVPSALVPLDVHAAEHNFVFNPLHPVARDVHVTTVTRLPFDQRLKH